MLYRLVVFLLLTHAFQIVKAETFVVGTQHLRYYPHYDFSDNSLDNGIGWAILQAYAKHSGHTFKYQPMPILRLQRELRKGNIDFVYPDSPRWYNDIIPTEDKSFSQPITHALSGTIVPKDEVGKPLEAIETISLLHGFTPVNWQQRLDSGNLELIQVHNVVSALQMLELRRAEATDMEYNVAQYLSASHRALGEYTLDTGLPHNIIGYHLSTLEHAQVLADLDRFIEQEADMIKQLHQIYQVDAPEQILERLKKEQQD